MYDRTMKGGDNEENMPQRRKKLASHHIFAEFYYFGSAKLKQVIAIFFERL